LGGSVPVAPLVRGDRRRQRCGRVFGEELAQATQVALAQARDIGPSANALQAEAIALEQRFEGGKIRHRSPPAEIVMRRWRFG
jgi:hypothetical protein